MYKWTSVRTTANISSKTLPNTMGEHIQSAERIKKPKKTENQDSFTQQSYISKCR